MTPAKEASPQIELFDGWQPRAERAPKLGLPFQRTNTIDIGRVAAILKISIKTALKLRHAGFIRGYLPEGRNKGWQIEYSSVVEYCDRLRVHNAISDRRVPLAAGRKRYRDDELLPFPWPQTVGSHEVAQRLDCSDTAVLSLIQCGALVAYQIFIDTPGSPWRIWEPSVDRYLERLHAQAFDNKPTSKPSSAHPSRTK